MLLALLLVYSALAWRLPSCSVTQFGAVGDGKTLNTVAIQKALTQCSHVVVPSGTFLSGALNISSDTTLEVLGTLLGSTNPEDYPVIPWLPSYPSGRDIPGPRYQPFLFTYQTKNITIQGKGGIINGNGPTWWTRFHQKTLKHGRPRLIETFEARDIRIFDLTLVNSAFWTVHIYDTDSVEIGHIKVQAPESSPNTDGIDPDSASNMYVHDVTISNGDDCIAVKSGLNDAGIKYGRPSVNITFERLHCADGHGLSIGSEMSGGIQNITFRDCKLRKVKRGCYLKTAAARGGYMKDIIYDNIELDHVPLGLSINTDYAPHEKTNTLGRDDVPLPVIENVKFTRIHGTADAAGDFSCFPTSPCKNMNFENIDISSTKGFSCKNIFGSQHDVHPKLCIQQ